MLFSPTNRALPAPPRIPIYMAAPIAGPGPYVHAETALAGAARVAWGETAVPRLSPTWLRPPAYMQRLRLLPSVLPDELQQAILGSTPAADLLPWLRRLCGSTQPSARLLARALIEESLTRLYASGAVLLADADANVRVACETEGAQLSILLLHSAANQALQQARNHCISGRSRSADGTMPGAITRNGATTNARMQAQRALLLLRTQEDSGLQSMTGLCITARALAYSGNRDAAALAIAAIEALAIEPLLAPFAPDITTHRLHAEQNLQQQLRWVVGDILLANNDTDSFVVCSEQAWTQGFDLPRALLQWRPACADNQALQQLFSGASLR